jgi:hypothetical protein
MYEGINHPKARFDMLDILVRFGCRCDGCVEMKRTTYEYKLDVDRQSFTCEGK